MKLEALEDVIIKHIGNIKKHCHRLPGSFDQEDIHDLRVNYKKTRAFLRLLQLEKGAGGLHLPDKLKAVYQVNGKVRDLQLFLAELHTLGIAPALPSCTTRWNQQLFSHKEEAVRTIEALHFKKLLNDLIKELPRQLHDDTIKKFMQQKIAAIHIVLLAADNEKDIHTIRKQVKDIVYTMRIYENDWAIPFPVSGWKSEKELSDLASTLGDFNDRCLAISLLQSGYNAECGENEKSKLQQLEKEWELQKETQQQQLLQQGKRLFSYSGIKTNELKN
jgi:CHAD domain-containing protein